MDADDKYDGGIYDDDGNNYVDDDNFRFLFF